MKTILVFGLVAAVASSVAVAADNSVMLTGVSSKNGGSAVALDVVSVGGVHALSLVANAPGASEKGADLSGCTAGLPKSWQVTCVVVNEQLRVGGFGSEALPAGSFSVGTVKLRGLTGAISLESVALGDQYGEPLQISSSVDVK